MPPATRPPAESSSSIPATPVMLIGFELKMACPRATAARGLAGGSSVHAFPLVIPGYRGQRPGFRLAGKGLCATLQGADSAQNISLIRSIARRSALPGFAAPRGTRRVDSLNLQN